MENMHFLLALVLGIVGIYFFYKSEIPALEDIPNHRSMHTKPVKRSAGIVLLIVFWILLPALYFSNSIDLPSLKFLSLGTLFFGILGFLDDLKNLSSRLKLILEFLFLLGLFTFFPFPLQIFTFDLNIYPWLKIPLMSIVLLFSINLINFMDGLDSYLSLSLIVYFLNAFFLSNSIHEGYGNAYLLLLSSSVGFMVLNLPNAKLFSGDSGSLALGFFMSVAPFFMETELKRGEITILALLLPAFWIDGIYTLLKRSYERKNILQAHREHLYQKVQQSGMFAKKQTLLHFHFINSLPIPTLLLLEWLNLPISPALKPMFVITPSIFYYTILYRKNRKHSTNLETDRYSK
jgi:UDP-N-acetylmuramyl pentapeptide phosphotransferase/UDP-N-acetylglucosamine-1-phosphate transferase